MMDSAIAPYIRKGYRVASQTRTSANLVRPKKFSFLAFFLLLLFGVVPGLVYFAWYLAKKDKSVYLYNDAGTLRVVDPGATTARLWMALGLIVVALLIVSALSQ